MKDATERWSMEEFKKYQRSGRMPEEQFPDVVIDDSGQKAVHNEVKSMISEAYCSEKELQKACENWLLLRGYLRLTPDNAEISLRGGLTRFFGHLVDTQKNAFMPDLFIMCDDRILNVELKVRNKFQAGQLEMILNGVWKLAATLEQFEDLVIAWENAA